MHLGELLYLFVDKFCSVFRNYPRWTAKLTDPIYYRHDLSFAMVLSAGYNWVLSGKALTCWIHMLTSCNWGYNYRLTSCHNHRRTCLDWISLGLIWRRILTRRWNPRLPQSLMAAVLGSLAEVMREITVNFRENTQLIKMISKALSVWTDSKSSGSISRRDRFSLYWLLLDLLRMCRSRRSTRWSQF